MDLEQTMLNLGAFHSPARLMVCLSGGGSTLLNILHAIKSAELDAVVPLVIASRECLGAQRARDAGIETVVIPGELLGSQVDELFDQYKIDLIVLAGYLKLMPITDRVEHRVINIHPALLPDFGGQGMHGMHVHRAVSKATKENGLDHTGCTVHFADQHYDTGAHIFQARCPCSSSDTPEEIAQRVALLEKSAYPNAIQKLISCNKTVCSAE